MSTRDGDDRNRADWGADPELLGLLRRVDPAHSLPPSTPGDLTRLAAAALAADAVEPGAHRPARTRWLTLAAAAALVLIGVTVSFSSISGDNSTPVADAPTDVAPAPTLLLVPAVTTSRCAVPSAELLTQQQVAFEGVVTSLADGTATLDTTTVFTGEVADQVEVTAPSARLGALLSAVQFEQGRSYLVSATDGQVALCGYSAAATPDLRALYQQSFGG